MRLMKPVSLTASAPPSPSSKERMEGGPLDGTRSEMVQRLQVGFGGILAIVILVGLASIIETRLRESEAAAVPEAAATDAPQATPTAADPLVDAGIVPDLPAASEAETSKAPSPAQSGASEELEE